MLLADGLVAANTDKKKF